MIVSARVEAGKGIGNIHLITLVEGACVAWCSR